MLFVFDKNEKVIASQKTAHKDGTLSVVHKETGIILRGTEENISKFINAYEFINKDRKEIL